MLLLSAIVCSGAPVEDASNARILVMHTGLPTPNTVFDYYFVTENDIKQDVTGKLGDDGAAVMKGKYEYTGPDKTRYRVTWYADHTGYHPSGEHLYYDNIV